MQPPLRYTWVWVIPFRFFSNLNLIQISMKISRNSLAAGKYHNSLTPGSNRRSYILKQTCSFRYVWASVTTRPYPTNTPRGFLVETTWKSSFPTYMTLAKFWKLNTTCSISPEPTELRISMTLKEMWQTRICGELDF